MLARGIVRYVSERKNAEIWRACMRKDSKTHKGLKRKLIFRTLFHTVSLKEAFLLIFCFYRHSTSVSSSKSSLNYYLLTPEE